MAQIDDGTTQYAFISLRGPVDPTGELVERITFPGLDGEAFRRAGKRGEPFELFAQVDLEGVADIVQTTNATYKALQGELVSVTDDYGSVWSNLMVVESRLVSARPAVSGVGGVSVDKAWFTVWRFVMQSTEVS